MHILEDRTLNGVPTHARFSMFDRPDDLPPVPVAPPATDPEPAATTPAPPAAKKPPYTNRQKNIDVNRALDDPASAHLTAEAISRMLGVSGSLVCRIKNERIAAGTLYAAEPAPSPDPAVVEPAKHEAPAEAPVADLPVAALPPTHRVDVPAPAASRVSRDGHPAARATVTFDRVVVEFWS